MSSFRGDCRFFVLTGQALFVKLYEYNGNLRRGEDSLEKKLNVHASHRARLKTRFLRQGLDHFEDHNVLELFLFYAIPQKDTNPIAHRLLARYGSLDAVFDAPLEDLMQVEGVGEHAATLIKLLPALASRYCASRFAPKDRLPEHDQVGAFFVSHFLDKQTESVYGLFYSSSLELVESCELFAGGLHSAAFSVREIAERAILKKASYVILAHNHPGGIPLASAADLDTTTEVRSFLRRMEVTLLDHFIVAEGRYFSLMKDLFDSERERILRLVDSL